MATARIRLPNPRILARQIEARIKKDPKMQQVILSRLQRTLAKEAEKVADTHLNGAIHTLQNMLSSGLGSKATTEKGLNRIIVKSVATGKSVAIPVSFSALHPKYRKVKQKLAGRDKFWLATGDLASRFSRIARTRRRSNVKVSMRRGSARPGVPFDLIVRLPRLPVPLDDLVRRSMISGEAQTAGTGKGLLSKIQFLELPESDSNPKSRPFIGRLSARLGRDMLADLKKL